MGIDGSLLKRHYQSLDRKCTFSLALWIPKPKLLVVIFSQFSKIFSKFRKELIASQAQMSECGWILDFTQGLFVLQDKARHTKWYKDGEVCL